MLSKKPFSTLKLAFGQLIFCSQIENLTDQPEFGMHFKSIHCRASVLYGRIEGIKRSEDKEHLVLDIVKVNKDGDDLNPVNPSENYIQVSIAINQNNVEFTTGSWADDYQRVKALVNKLNNESIAGIRKTIEAALAMENLIKDAVTVSEK